MIELITQIIVPIVLAYCGYSEVRMRRLEEQLNKTPDRKEVAALVTDKLEATKVMQSELKEDIRRLEAKLDLILLRGSRRQD